MDDLEWIANVSGDGGVNSELEKFKRRLIRAVARMLIREKRNEDEVWTGLRQETGCDCKEIWSRMHDITVKKLEKLLNAGDHVQLLPKAARMNITDWLMFDLVLVHEDIDVIGMSDTASEDRTALLDLFDLVEKHKVEFLAGSQLTDAWLRVTLQYNRRNRQCTPMLLQRRWYQLKLATRARFYKFWAFFKGNEKSKKLGEAYKPTKLQATLATRYKPLVVSKFSSWEELVENNLVILPEQFEVKGNIRSAPKPDDTTPDVQCVEPTIETIDLDDDSDTEIEYRKPVQPTKQLPFKIKKELKDSDDVDEVVPYENRQERMIQFSEAVLVSTAMELDQIYHADDIDDDDSDNTSDVNKESCNKESRSHNLGVNITTDAAEDTSLVKDGSVTQQDAKDNETNIASVIDNHEAAVDLDVEEVKMENEEQETENLLPMITSVFSGVEVSEMGILTPPIANIHTVIDDNCSKIANAVENKSDLDNSTGIPVTDDNVDNKLSDDVDVKATNSWFGELSNDIDFADDGIQLEEDEPVEEMPVIETETNDVNEEGSKTSKEDEEENEHVSNVDEKLLLVPAVKVVKLDDMGILPVHLLKHIDSKYLIEVINLKSSPIKPIVPKVIVKKEVETIDAVTVEQEVCPSEFCDQIDDPKIVKLSSRLLQKPRNCSYHPIQLCKNPDFNTRLKKLNIGFFGSARNRLLLKSCKPISIDVSKAFENKLVNGTMFLKTSDMNDVNLGIEPNTNNQVYSASVVPSAMAVQSLIDNTSGEIPPPSYSSFGSKPIERNKVINLPDITEIRRINQNLLTAEVTPLPMQQNSDTNVAPKSTKRTAGPASRTKTTTQQHPQAVNITKSNKDDAQTNNTSVNKDSSKIINRNVPWRPKHRPEISWYYNKTNYYTEDTLLALDTLNKMLYYITEGDVLPVKTKSRKGKRGPHSKAKTQTSNPTETPEPTIAPKPVLEYNDDNDDVQIVCESIPEEEEPKTFCKEKPPSVPAGQTKIVYCCWARERICQLLFTKRSISRHNCPFPLCLCCCKMALIEFIQKRKREFRNKNKTVVHTSKDVEADESNDDVIVIDSRDISDDVAEIIPIGPQVYTVSGSESESKNIPATVTRKDIAVNTDPDFSVTNTGAEISIVDSDSDVSMDNTDVGIVNTDTEVSIDNTKKELAIANIEVTVADTDTNISKGNTSISKEMATNTDAAIPSDEEIERSAATSSDHSSQELGNVIDDASMDCAIIDADVSVTTSEHINAPQHISKPINITINQASIIPTKQYAPRIRIRPADPKDSEVRSIVSTRQLKNNQKRNEVHSENIPTKVVVLDSKAKITILRDSKVQPRNINHKMTYLNSKQISQLPTDNPIFLGKNRILLTTAKYPSNFRAFEAFQANIKQTLAIPKGIQLVLLPSGRLTYIRDRKVFINNKFTEALPQLIEAIQQQINGESALVTESNPQNEVIDLSEDETQNINEKGTGSINVQDITKTCSSEIVLGDPEAATSTDNVVNVNAESDSEKILEVTDTTVNTGKTTGGATNTHSEVDISTATGSMNGDISANIADSDTTGTTDLDDNSGKCNILSDLMAMSGIEPTDTIPTPPEASQIESQLDCLRGQVLQNLNNDKIDPKIRTALTKTLTPITSLSELKYACAQNSSFFKLDVQTGLLLSINVCMKKITEKKQSLKTLAPKVCLPVEPIDLTEDDIAEVSAQRQTKTQSLLISNQPNAISADSTRGSNANKVVKQVNVDYLQDLCRKLNDNESTNVSLIASNEFEIQYTEITNANQSKYAIDQSIRGHNVSEDGQIKRLKLIQLPQGQKPNILVKKLKEIQRKIAETKTAESVIRSKLKRKQTFDNALENKTKISRGLDISGDSSDEEPLATKAVKMRTKEILDENTEININKLITINDDDTESLQNYEIEIKKIPFYDIPGQDSPMEVDTDIPTEKSQVKETVEDLTMEEDEEMRVPVVIVNQAGLDEADPDEDCILGV